LHPIELIEVGKSFSHHSGTVNVLKGLQFKAEQAETVAIVGPSGSGKSTLLSILAGLDQPDSGQVKIMGTDILTLSEVELTKFRAAHLGIVFQQFHLMNHLTALENVELPLQIKKSRDVREEALEALDKVGLKDRADHFPNECSGGECQRIAIARAIISKPNLILADEPSGNLDVKTGDHVMKLLFEVVKEVKATLILVTHNEGLASWCDKKYLLGSGKLEAI